MLEISYHRAYLFLYGNGAHVMTEHNSTQKPPGTSKTTEHLSKALKTHDAARSMIGTQIMKGTVSDALRAVLESQGRVTELAGNAGRTHQTIRNAIDAALEPSHSIKAALDAMPSFHIQKTLQQLPTVRFSNLNARPTHSARSEAKNGSELDPHVLNDVAQLGQAVRSARKARRLTQQKFADLAGVGRRLVSDLEGGKQTLEIGKVLKVAAAAGIRLSFVCTDDQS